jgi:cobalt-precorrin 5A hydrolase
MTSICHCVKIFTISDKREESGLIQAAEQLGLDMMFLPRDALRAQAAKIHTASSSAERRFGVPSVAEAAALAGAGPGSTLILPRIANAGATCAIAASRA